MTQRQLIIALYVVVFCALGGWAGALLVDSRREFNHRKLIQADLQRQVDAKRAQLKENERILKRLKDDPFFLEKVMRRRMTYAKPGDTVFVFPE